MKTLLQINSGLQGDLSHSSRLADKLASSLLRDFPNARHIKRDLSTDPIPHLEQTTFQAFSNPDFATTPAQKSKLRLSNTLIEELIRSDILVIGAPMYNLHIASTLKSWIDHVTRADLTFRYSEAGPIGLLMNKKAYVAVAQGGKFLETPADYQTGYLRSVLGLIGIRDVDFVFAEGLAMGPHAAASGLQIAHQKIETLFNTPAA